jgi:hypothetical protein
MSKLSCTRLRAGTETAVGLLLLALLPAGCATMHNPAVSYAVSSSPPSLAELTLPCEEPSGSSQELSEEPSEEEVWRANPHHLSLVFAITHDRGQGDNAFTLGLDYEYRLNSFLGLGAVIAEHAFGDVDATTFLAVADLHVWRGLAFQTGPGVEFIDSEMEWVYRLGALYEIEFGELTVSPQIHYDATSSEDAILYAIAVGYYF